MQPSDIGRLVSVGDPRVAPDGLHIAFTVTRVDLEANRYRSAIWLAAADGDTPPRQLTAGEHGDGQPVWSPDGTRLAFTSKRADAKEQATLHVMPVGVPGETLTLCTRAEAIEAPVWSPDGTRIAFASRERTGRYEHGDDDRARPPRRIDHFMSRLDGEGWIIDRPRSIFVVPAAGAGEPRLVAGGPFEHGDPAWSPDGTRLVVSTTRDKDWDLRPVDQLFLVPVDGDAEPVQLTDGELSHRLPSFSPDGTAVATGTADELLIHTHGQIAVVDVETGKHRILTAGLDRQCTPYPGARPAIWVGEHLLFALEERGSVHIYRVRADGAEPPELVVGGVRQLTGYDHAGDTLAFVAATPTSLPELYAVTADGTERQLTRLGEPFTTAVPPAVPEHFTAPSPAGDVELDVWIVRPEGDGPHPVLLAIHGGPMAQYPNAWFDEFQLWVGAGYAVVYCNPHGSTGLTEAFARAIRAPDAAEHPGTGWGGIDADDVLAALDAALERDPTLDGERAGVLGGSYGGYLTSWLIGHTNRFAAACSERSVNNMESAEWSADVGGFFRFEVGATHLDAPETYRRISPISYVRDIETPVLIIHSENDLRCHIEQADSLFVALRLLGKPVEYWRFPEESHGLSRNGSPRHRVQRAEIILDWFGKHLGGARPEIGWTS